MIAISGLMANTIQAQTNNTDLRERFLFGLKLGANYSNVYDSEGENFIADPKLGLATGAFFAIPFGRYLGIQPELLFSQKGFKATGSLAGSTYQLTRTSNFIDIPLFLAFKRSEFITILAGPQFSYLTKQKDAFANATTTIETEREFVNDDVRKNTLCAVAGIDLTMKHLVLGVRAGWDLQNNHVNSASTTPRYKNVWYQATLGYRFYNN
jgi:hypothetical protein